MPSTSNTPDTASGTSEAKKPAIVIHNIRKTFKIKHTNSFKESFVAALQRKELSSDFNAIDGLSIEVPEGQSIALLGRNGSGKSTTLKMLSGVMRPDAGWIRTRGRIAGLLEVGAGFNPNLTGRDNVYLNAAILGMSKEETKARFDDILEFSEIGEFIDTEVKHYSSGMYARLGFAVAVHTEFDILLVDEILSVGDAVFRKKCEDRMLELRQLGKTIFVVSHNAGQVRKLCERGIVLEDGKMKFDGLIDEALAVMAPEKVTAPLPFIVPDAINSIYESHAKAFGLPTAPAVTTDKHGGGQYQQFEKGIITHLNDPNSEFGTMGLTNGLFLAAYIDAGGPEGPWGFIAGSPKGRVEDFEMRAMRFQNGIAGYTMYEGMRFRFA